MIEFKHVNKKYPNGFEALKDIDLTIGQGEFVAIIGLSGAGKSTLIRCVNRLDTPTEGRILIDGQNVLEMNKRDLRKMRRKVSMIFQQFNLLMQQTVEDRLSEEILEGNISFGDQVEMYTADNEVKFRKKGEAPAEEAAAEKKE